MVGGSVTATGVVRDFETIQPRNNPPSEYLRNCVWIVYHSPLSHIATFVTLPHTTYTQLSSYCTKMHINENIIIFFIDNIVILSIFNQNEHVPKAA